MHFGELFQVLSDDGRQLSQRKVGKEQSLALAVSRLIPLSSIQIGKGMTQATMANQ